MNKRTAPWLKGVLAIVLACGGGAAAAAGVVPVATPQARLAALAGQWSVRQSLWLDPGSAPVVDHGTATWTMVLGGRHLRQNLRIASRQPFEGLGYIGYDDAVGRYDSSWMDTNFTGMIVAHGDYDAASRSYTFVGAMTGKDGQPVPMREVMHVDDHDHFVCRYYEIRHGREALVVSLEYTRSE
jgi:hypothetical protein